MRIFYAFTIWLLTSYSTAFAQTSSFRGQVRSKLDSVLAGVSVTIKGASKSYVTDGKGEFAISNLKLPVVLIFSSVGYKTQALTLKKADTTKFITIKLSPFEADLAEVVVVGYGTAKKKDM